MFVVAKSKVNELGSRKSYDKTEIRLMLGTSAVELFDGLGLNRNKNLQFIFTTSMHMDDIKETTLETTVCLQLILIQLYSFQIAAAVEGCDTQI